MTWCFQKQTQNLRRSVPEKRCDSRQSNCLGYLQPILGIIGCSGSHQSDLSHINTELSSRYLRSIERRTHVEKRVELNPPRSKMSVRSRTWEVGKFFYGNLEVSRIKYMQKKFAKFRGPTRTKLHSSYCRENDLERDLQSTQALGFADPPGVTPRPSRIFLHGFLCTLDGIFRNF